MKLAWVPAVLSLSWLGLGGSPARSDERPKAEAEAKSEKGGAAAAEASEEETDPAARAKSFRWETVGGMYLDPTSFFSLHGYVNAVFAGFSRDWTAPDPTQVGMPGQLLVPNTRFGAFQQDLMLMVSSEMSSRNRAMIELHLVSDPMGGPMGAAGPAGLTIAWTEANASWDIVPPFLTLTGGLYWAPFGTVNQDWMGAQNLFTLIPRASGAFPAHWNERGVRLHGAVGLGGDFGVNYVLSLGNGIRSYDIMGLTSFDFDQNKTLVGRVGVFPGLGTKLNVGYSFAFGALRVGGDPTLPADNPQAYAATIIAHGGDVSFAYAGLLVRGYAILSQESFEAAGAPAPPTLNRLGALAEVSYLFTPGSPWWIIKSVLPKVRFDFIDTATLASGGTVTSPARTAVVSFGVNLYPNAEFQYRSERYPYENFYLSLEYHIQSEMTGASLDNDRFVVKLTGRF